MQAAVSVIRNSEVVRYSGAANVLYIYEISVGTYGSVRYSVEVRYSECPLIETPLYTSILIDRQARVHCQTAKLIG